MVHSWAEAGKTRCGFSNNGHCWADTETGADTDHERVTRVGAGQGLHVRMVHPGRFDVERPRAPNLRERIAPSAGAYRSLKLFVPSTLTNAEMSIGRFPFCLATPY
jgi:hypothetical protein